MKQVVTAKVTSITEDEHGRTAYFAVEGQRSWTQTFKLQVPVEQPLAFGDGVTLEISWPE